MCKVYSPPVEATKKSMNSPWGTTDSITSLEPGFISVTTPGHGGIMVHESAVSNLPKNILAASIKFGPWYAFEEDCAENLVFAALPSLYRSFIKNCLTGFSCRYPTPGSDAEKELMEHKANLEAKLALSDDDLVAPLVKSNIYWYPELFGFGPRCDVCRQCGCAGHQNDLIVVSAFGSWHKDVPKGMVGVFAVQGGNPMSKVNPNKTKGYFLVSESEYDSRDNYFVVDLAKHSVWQTDMALQA